MTEGQKNRLIKKIESYKKEMRREKKEWGGYHDGRGLRYSLAELHFKLGDYKKTNRYISWFDKNFPSDSTYAYFQLGTALTKFHTNKKLACKKRIVNVISHNTYLPYLLVGAEIKDQDKYEWNESESLSWAKERLTIHKGLLDQTFIDWLSEFINEASFTKKYNEYISIKKLLKGMEVSEKRTKLLDAEKECLGAWKKELAG